MAYKSEEKKKANAHKYYETTGKANTDALIIRNREYLRQYKASHPCVDCGETRWWVLEFDHRKGTVKRYNISRMRCIRLETIQMEIAKCDIRCRNCHADRHHREGNFNASE